MTIRHFLLLPFLLLFLFPLSAKDNPYSYPLGTVVIDAGHGGKDGGCSFAWVFAGGTVYEKDLNLDIAKRVRDIISVQRPDIRVVMTREDDSYISLDDRCAIAYGTPLAAKSSALFVSIHVNSAESRDASGFEVLTKLPSQTVSVIDASTPRQNISLYAPFSQSELNRMLGKRDREVADCFVSSLSASLPETRNRGVKEQNVQVLWCTRIPSVLLEVGFLTNEQDARNLVSASWRQQMANAIVLAILGC